MAAVTGAEANLTPERMAEIIRDKTAGNRERRETIDRLRSDLGHAMGNWTRDWQRIATTESNNAIQEGTAGTIEQRHGADVLVSKMPRPDACPDCRRLYTRGGEPIIFKLSELRANGSNVGRRKADWKPTIEAIHPWCGCMLVRVPEGMVWEDGELRPAKVEKSERRRRPTPLTPRPLILDMRLEKAGPFIGPKGGKWADAAHTIPWHEQMAAFLDSSSPSEKVRTWARWRAADPDHWRGQHIGNRITDAGVSEFQEIVDNPAHAEYAEAVNDINNIHARLKAKIENAGAKRKADAASQRYERQGVELDSGDRDPLAKVRGKRVWLYHGTSTALLDEIRRNGLRPSAEHGKQSNVGASAHSKATPDHVYLTSRTNGPASSDHYARVAAAEHGGDPVVIRVLVDGNDLDYDPDDADLTTGRQQFVVPAVAPKQIMEIGGKRAREKLTKARRPTPLTPRPLILDMRLEKAGPYIGPRGGKWADPEHTIPWQETDPLAHGHEHKVGDKHEVHPANKGWHPFEAHVVGEDAEHYMVAQSAGGYGTKIPKASLSHFLNDMRGVVHGEPTSSNEHVNAVVSGKAEHLGKGDDGIAFRHGSKVVKVSTTVPYQPFNPGHLTPAAAADRLEQQVAASNAMHDAGVPGIMRSEFVRHGDKGYQIKPYVEIPTKLTREQLDSVAESVTKAHEAGWVFGDEIQVGVHDGKLVHFDTGKAHPFKENGPGRPAHFGTEKDDDISALKRLFAQHGEKYLTDEEKADPSGEWEDLMGAKPEKMSPDDLKAHTSKLLRHSAKMRAFIKNNPGASIFDEKMIDEDMRTAMAKVRALRKSDSDLALEALEAFLKDPTRGKYLDDEKPIAKALDDAGGALAEVAASPQRLAMMSWRGNEDADRPQRAADLTGANEEAGLTVKGKKKRKKAKEEAREVARASRMSPEERFAPAKRIRRPAKGVQQFTPDTLIDAREGARESADVKRERIRDDLERRDENKPPTDPVRIARARGES